MEEDLYALLELSPSCTTDEIKRQYKKLALQYHPDRHQTASDSQRTHFEKKFKEVARAYEVLSDPAARRQYDALRSNPPQQQQEDYSYTSSHQYPHAYTRDSRSTTRTNSSNNGGASGWRNDDPFHSFGFEQRSTPHQTPPVAGGGGGYGRHRSPFASFFDDFVFRDPFAIFNEMFQSTMHPSMASHHRRDVVDDGGFPFGFGMMKHMMMGNHLLVADPFAMFHGGGGGFGFHENDDPFPSMFSVDKRHPQRQHPFAGLLMGGGGDPFSMFGSSSSAMPGGMKMMMSYSSSTMTTTMGRGAEESGVQRHTTTTTTTVGPTGQRVTKTVRTVQRPNGLVTEDVEEEVAQSPPQQQQRRYAPPLPPSRAALPPPTHRSSESRDPQPQQQPQQQQQSPPPLRRAHPSSQQQRYHSLPPAASRAAPPTALPYHPHHHHQPVPSSSSPSLPISHQRLPQRATVTHY